MSFGTMAAIRTEKVVGIVRADTAERARQAARAMLTGGLRVVEVALTTPGALDVIGELAADKADDVVVGAGTVLDAESARLATLAGATLLVSPSLCPEVIRTGRRYGAAVLPGCATPTEMLTALEAGADAVKLFPASLWTPEDLHAVRQALPQLPVIPTGGITPADAPRWIQAGAIAVGLGSALTAGGPDATADRVKQFRTALDTVTA
ncbi:MAG: bifunctional 4-hydroxy-2-oxoglutarate aldolase/2-dehydro-3-deoxy-phosphogluconate aldolase [Micromonosporaceae bacterium]